MVSAALAARHEKAERRLATASAAVAVIEKRLAGRHWSELDSATGSGVRRKPNAKADARRYNGYDRDGAAYAALVEAEKAVRATSAQIATAKRNAPIPFTPDELKAAVLIRTAQGWRKVVKVNAKSVSVATGYSWVDRIPKNDITAVM